MPHAGRTIPAWTRPHLLLDDAGLAAEVEALTDHRTDELARAAAAPGTTVLVNEISRFVVDVERFPDEREEMAAVGMAAVYTHGTRRQRIRAADPGHRDALLDAYFHPWAQRVADAVDGELEAEGRAVVLDLHSYPTEPLPYELHADGPRPPVCLGTDRVHTPAWLVAAARTAFGEVGLDSPFSGTYVPLRHHGIDPRVSSIMIELRRDTYLHDAAGFDRIVTALTTLVNGVRATYS